jgi:hypothetical protein
MGEMNPSEYFQNYVERSFEESINDVTDDYKARVACMFCFHMTDAMNYYYYKMNDKNLKKKLGQNIQGYCVVQAVCNASKHLIKTTLFKQTGGPEAEVSAGDIRVDSSFLLLENGSKILSEDGKSALLLEDSGTYLNTDGRKYDVHEALKSVVDFWKEELERPTYSLESYA